MTDTIVGIAGLVLTILGIPCALAFTFSSAYKKVLGYVIIALLFLLLLFALTWTGAVLFALNILKDHINVANAKSALEIVEFWKLSTGSFFILLAAFLAASIWVYGLRFVDDLKKWEQTLEDQKDAAEARKRHLEWHSNATRQIGTAPEPAKTPQAVKTPQIRDRS